jgi:hypothetical protein
MSKIGRNKPCPCGSGLKYKRCHGKLTAAPGITPPPQVLNRSVELALARAKARQVEVERQHGRGRPPISVELQRHRIVAVGPNLHWSSDWKTFHDFLFNYYKFCLGQEWWMAQVAKPAAEWHPLFRWYFMVCEYQKEHITKPGEAVSRAATGAVEAVLWLAYGLYLLEHNLKIQDRLLCRLRSDDKVQVYAALYEVWITGTMIWAGFDLVLEDEGDGRRTHCEFTATAKETGKRYSVEAKVFRPGSEASDGRDRVNRQLARALRKQADHERIIFIDLNEANPPPGDIANDWLKHRAWTVRRQERTLKDAPPACVFLTNYPYRHHLRETTGFARLGVMEGFKIAGLKFDAAFNSLRAVGDFREQNADLYRLCEAMRDIQIPQTFDGQPPSRAFATGAPGRLLVGERYQLPGPDGALVIGELKQGIVIDPQKLVSAVFELEGGQNAIYQVPITDEELQAYRESPETFFGVHQEVTKKIENPLDLYEWILRAYRNTPKERLLEFLQGHRDIDKLKDLPGDELAKVYAEGIAASMAQRSPSV